MKKAIYFFLAAPIFLFSCVKVNLPRDNGYDENFDAKPEYSLSVSRWEIVEESKVDDDSLEEDESVYLRVWIRNDGPDPAPQLDVYFETNEYDHMDIDPESIEKVDSVPGAIVEDVISPGMEGFANFRNSPNGSAYSVRIRKLYSNITSVTVTATIQDNFEQTFTGSKTFPVK